MGFAADARAHRSRNLPLLQSRLSRRKIRPTLLEGFRPGGRRRVSSPSSSQQEGEG